MEKQRPVDPTPMVPETTERRPSKERLREQGTKIKEDFRDLGRIGREVSEEKLGEARQAANQYLERGKERAGDLEDSVVGYVRQKPLKSLAIAIGAGALLGMIVGRR